MTLASEVKQFKEENVSQTDGQMDATKYIVNYFPATQLINMIELECNALHN